MQRISHNHSIGIIATSTAALIGKTSLPALPRRREPHRFFRRAHQGLRLVDLLLIPGLGHAERDARDRRQVKVPTAKLLMFTGDASFTTRSA